MRSFCKHCNKEVELMEVGFRKIFEDQRYKCSLCGSPIVPKRHNWVLNITLILLVLGLIIFLASISSAYSSTVTVTDTSLGQIRSDFYGANTGGFYLVGDDTTYGTKISHTGAYLNSTEYSQAWLNANLKLNRLDASLNYYYQNITGGNGVNFTDTNTNDRNFTRIIKTLQFNKDNGIKSLVIIGYMPSWLADNSSGKCWSYAFCPATNYTKFTNIVLDFINRSTNGNETILNNTMFEIWNEPDGSFFMQGISNNNINQYYNYSVLYNQTYTAIKTIYPNTEIIAPTLAFWNSNNLKLNFLSNWSSRVESYSFHSYTNLCSSPQGNCGGNANGTYDYITMQLNDVSTKCSTYGASCKNIYISEWNDADDHRKNSTTQYMNFSQEIAQGYSAMLNWNASRVSSIFYEFGEVTNFTGSGDRYEMFSGRQLANYQAPSYNITKLFATNHKAGNTVYNSTSTNSSLKVVVSKDATKTYITLTNTLNEAVNVSLNDGLPNTNWIDNATGTRYGDTILNVPAYGVMTFQSETPAINITPYPTNPANGSTINSKYISMGWNITLTNPLSSILLNWNNTQYSLFDDSLVLYYNFDNRSALGENDTLVKDISKYGNNGTIYNLSWNTNFGLRNYGGFEFMENTSATTPKYISIPQVINGTTNNWTVSIWIKPYYYSHSDSAEIIKLIGTYNFRIKWEKTTERCFATQYNGSTGGDSDTTGYRFNLEYIDPITKNCEIGKWHHIVVTKTGLNNISFYTDGKLTSRGTFFGDITTAPSSAITLGTHNSYSNTNYMAFNGSIDDLIIWNKTLNLNEVQTLYASSLTKLNNTNYNIDVNISPANLRIYNYIINLNDSLNNNLINTQNVYYNYITTAQYNFNTFLGKVHKGFYGVSANYKFWFGYNTTIDANNDGTREKDSNLTWHKEKLLNSKMGIVRVDMGLGTYYSNTSLPSGVNLTGNLTNHIETVKFAKSNNITILYIADYMPTWLADNSSGECSNLAYCKPTDYQKWANLVIDFLNSTNCTDGTCEVEVWNEPYGSFLSGNLAKGHNNKSIAYVKIYNATYYTLNKTYPNIRIGGPSGFRTEKSLTDHFLDNQSYYGYDWDFLSYHPYGYARINYDEQLNDLLWIQQNCTSFGVNCKDIYMTEWSVGDAGLKNTSSISYLYGNSYAQSYISLLNYKPNETTGMIHEWSAQYKYYNNPTAPTYYPEFPAMWSMVSEPNLDNQLFASYTITSNFTRYGNNNIYNSSISENQVKTTSSITSNNKRNIIFVNKQDDYQNISLTVSGASTLIDVTSGQLYDTSDGSINGLILEPYEVVYLTEPIAIYSEGDWYLANYLYEPIRPMSSEEEDFYLNAEIETCTTTLEGLESFGTFTGILVIVLIAGSLIFIIGKTDAGEFNTTEATDWASVIIIAAVVIGVGSIIISNMTGGC